MKKLFNDIKMDARNLLDLRVYPASFSPSEVAINRFIDRLVAILEAIERKLN